MILKPEPDSDLRNNEIVMGKDIIKSLKETNKNYEVLNKLLKKFLAQDQTRTPKEFMRTLIFLYTAEVIDVSGLQIKLTNLAKRDVNQTTSLEDFGGQDDQA